MTDYLNPNLVNELWQNAPNQKTVNHFCRNYSNLKGQSSRSMICKDKRINLSRRVKKLHYLSKLVFWTNFAFRHLTLDAVPRNTHIVACSMRQIKSWERNNILQRNGQEKLKNYIQPPRKKRKEFWQIPDMKWVYSEYPEWNTKRLFSQILQELQTEDKFNFLHGKLHKGRNRNAEKRDRLTSGALDYWRKCGHNKNQGS